MKGPTFSREELYELVWLQPISRLAAKFGISGGGLAKLCARHEIPRPPRGYWARRAAGKVDPVPGLPRTKDTQLIQLPAWKPVPASGQATDLERAIADAKRPENRIAVPSRLRNPFDAVRETKEALTGANVDRVGLLVPPEDCMPLRVSPAQLGHALRLADTLLKAFSKRE